MYRDLAQDPDQIVDSHEISVELKTSAEGEEEVVRSFSQNLQKSPKRKWSNLAKITVLVVFVFITGEVLSGAVTRVPQLEGCVCACVCVIICKLTMNDLIYCKTLYLMC